MGIPNQIFGGLFKILFFFKKKKKKKKQSHFVEDILTEFWNWNILNVIVLIPTQSPQLQATWNKVHRKPSNKPASE